MEITNKTKNTLTDWCKRLSVPVDAEELKNYKHFLALDGLSDMAQNDRLAVATMKIAANGGALGYVSTELNSKIYRDMWGKEEVIYTPVFKDDNCREFYRTLQENQLNYCVVYDRQRGRFYICYLPDEVEDKKAELLQKQQAGEKKSQELNAEITAGKREKELLEDKLKQLDVELYHTAHCNDTYRKAISALKYPK